MDYIGNKCPVCNQYFHADDDIVVCPECGTPHHRACYEQEGHCHNEPLHKQGFDYTAPREDTDTELIKRCPSCGKENDRESFFCKYCGSPLSPDKTQSDNNRNYRQEDAANPFGYDQGGAYGVPFLDPLGGVPNDTDLGDGVTAGEAAKYVKQNTPYFIRVFSNIKNFNKSKFNFAAALFMGGYMLYRKMYKLGAIFAALQLAFMITEIYLNLAFSSLFVEFAKAYSDATDTASLVSNISQFMNSVSTTDLLILYLPTFLDIIRIIMMIVIGLCFNRLYMNHCKKQIIRIKTDAEQSSDNAETLLQTKGGVNIALAVSLLITAMIINYLPRILSAGLF